MLDWQSLVKADRWANIYKSLNLTWLLLLSKVVTTATAQTLSLHLVRLQRHANNKSSYTLPPVLFYPAQSAYVPMPLFDNSASNCWPRPIS
ncbi:MAG: hypothetical protein R2788_19870 [Saprospiraceae bacterium]